MGMTSEALAKRQPGSFLTTYVDVMPADDPSGGLCCLFQRTDGQMMRVHERDMRLYHLLHTMLRDSKNKDNPILAAIGDDCRIELAREWGAFEQAEQGLAHKRTTDPYAGVPAMEVAGKLFKRLREGIVPAALKQANGPNPS